MKSEKVSSENASKRFSLTGHFVRVTKGGRRPHLSFFRPEYSVDANGYRRIEKIEYLGWRIVNKSERFVLRNYRPSFVVQSEEKRTYLNFSAIGKRDRYPQPRQIRTGPVYTLPPMQPIQKARFTVVYIDRRGVARRRRLLFRFYDKKSLQRFQALGEEGKMPIPVSGNTVNFGIEPWRYRIRNYTARRGGHGS